MDLHTYLVFTYALYKQSNMPIKYFKLSKNNDRNISHISANFLHTMFVVLLNFFASNRSSAYCMSDVLEIMRKPSQIQKNVRKLARNVKNVTAFFCSSSFFRGGVIRLSCIRCILGYSYNICVLYCNYICIVRVYNRIDYVSAYGPFFRTIFSHQ